MRELRQLEISCTDGYATLLEKFSGLGMVAKELGEAFKIMVAMFQDKDCHRLLGLAGATVASGFRNLITSLVRMGFVNTIVTTGANITHDMIEAIGGRHYILEKSEIDDRRLARAGIYRIYNVAVKRESYEALERFVDDALRDVSGTLSSMELIKILSSKIEDRKSFLRAAYECGVEVYCPAIADSILGSQIRFRTGGRVKVDTLSDIERLVDRVWSSKRTGALFLGGGTPKHFIMMAANTSNRPLSYAIQVTTDREEHGGLSGAKLEEAKSWGKVMEGGLVANVCLDISVALPLLVLGLEEVVKGRKTRSKPK